MASSELSTDQDRYFTITHPVTGMGQMVVTLEARLTEDSKSAVIALYRGTSMAFRVSINTPYYKPYRLRIPFIERGVLEVRIGSLHASGAAGADGAAGCQVRNIRFEYEPHTPKQPYDDNLIYIAHRGDTRLAPENTMPAFMLARQFGFNAIETDISVTSDGHFVLLHDDTINRTSNGIGPISGMTLEEARQYDYGAWFDQQYNGTSIVTLTEFLHWCRMTGIRPVLEIKTDTTYDRSLAESLVRTIKDASMWDRCDIISFGMPQLQAVAAIDNTARFALIGEPSQSNIDSLKALGNNVYYSIYGGDLTVGAALCRSNGLRYISSSNDGDMIRISNEIGCFGICTDGLNLSGCML